MEIDRLRSNSIAIDGFHTLVPLCGVFFFAMSCNRDLVMGMTGAAYKVQAAV